MANVSKNLRNRLNRNIQTYTQNRLKNGSANSASFIKTINEIINIVHRGNAPALSPRPRMTNNNQRPATRNGGTQTNMAQMRTQNLR